MVSVTGLYPWVCAKTSSEAYLDIFRRVFIGCRKYLFLSSYYNTMVKKHMKSSDGHYHIHGRKYEELEGSRAKVWHQTAYKTSGGLLKHHLIMNKHGRIVSKKKHGTAKKEKRLEKAGYKTRKGKFGFVKSDGSKKAKKGSRKSKKGSRKSRK